MVVKKSNKALTEQHFDDWTKPLDSLLNSKYFVRLTARLTDLYAEKKELICPSSFNVFKAFKSCSYVNLKVVILGQDPYFDGYSATGLAFANPKKYTSLSPSLDLIFDNINAKTYDPSLEKWAEQGVLLLNSALTVEKYKPLSHLRFWSGFTANVIRTISTSKKDTIFCLWGNVAQGFRRFIDEDNNYVLVAEHPAAAARNNRYWECDHFDLINDILKSNKKSEIKW